jgi:uncharacterized membrane protein HdeD (DUF308 family)
MDQLLRDAWWMPVLRGVLAIAFGVLALIVPGATLLVLVALFAAWALVGGVASIVAAYKNRTTDKWWLVLLLGIVSIAAGVVAVMNPGITIFVLVLLMGANALVTGVLEIAMAVRLRKSIQNEWLLVLAGAVSVLFGIAVLVFPPLGAIAMVWLVSFYATLTGVLLVALGVRARKWGPRGGDRADPNIAKRDERGVPHPGHPA